MPRAETARAAEIAFDRGKAGEGADGPCLRTLIIDDNVDSAQGLAHYLRTLGHQVHLAHSGRSGIEAARNLRPDAVLLDIGLPDLSGYEVARYIRNDPELTSTALIAVTGYGREVDRLETAAAGFHRHLVKPVDLDALRLALGEIAVLPQR